MDEDFPLLLMTNMKIDGEIFYHTRQDEDGSEWQRLSGGGKDMKLSDWKSEPTSRNEYMRLEHGFPRNARGSRGTSGAID